MATITIDARFCGPPTSANGGYFAGSVAALADTTVTVRLLQPPPLDTSLEVAGSGGKLEVRHGATLIAQTRPATLEVPEIVAPEYVIAIEASRHYPGFENHPAPTCFVCGPQRTRGDGLRIFPGPLSEGGRVAAPWVPDESLDAGDGKVRGEFMWAALDCPGWLAVAPGVKAVLLGELTAHVDRRVHVGERCVVVGWSLGSEGRKHTAGTALFDHGQQLCAYARALWIEPRA